MSRLPRRDFRFILVDSEKTAKEIENFCLENRLVDGKDGWDGWTTCRTFGTIRVSGKIKWQVRFVCTLREWDRIMKHYNLKKLGRRACGIYYELGL